MSKLMFGVALLSLGLALPVLAQQKADPNLDKFPAGPEKALIADACTACHSLARVAFGSYDAAGWRNAVAMMMNAGAALTPDDAEKVTNYLIKSFPEKPLPPFKMAVSPNSPCKLVPPAVQAATNGSGATICLYPAYLESLPGGISYTVLDQVEQGPADDFGPVRVPQGRVFLMGDNRDDSLDSRFSAAQGGIGMVPVDDLIGRAFVTFWSTDGSASYWKPWTWFSALRASRIGNGYTGEAD